MIPLCALILSIVAGAVAQLTIKAGLLETASMAPGILLALGVGFYGVAMIAWVFALTEYDLSVAYPTLSLGYLLVYAGAHFWPALGEELTWNKTIGLMLIIVGVTVSAQKSGTDVRDESERKHLA